MKKIYKKIKKTEEIPPIVQEAMDRANRAFHAWYQKQEKDFEDNKDAVSSHMLSRGKLVPPNFKRFWKWYFEYCAENDFDLTREIEPRDLVLYDKWEREQMYSSHPKEEAKNLSVKTCAICLAIANKFGRISEETANSKKAIITLAHDLFSFNPAGIYDNWREYRYYSLERLENLPEYNRAMDIFKEHFE